MVEKRTFSRHRVLKAGTIESAAARSIAWSAISRRRLRNTYWFIRNPIGNFMGFVIGCEGFDYG
jgi:hypothetical protein